MGGRSAPSQNPKLFRASRGHRKFSVVLLSLTMGFVLSLLGKLTPEFTQIVSISVGAFMLANAAVEWANKE